MMTLKVCGFFFHELEIFLLEITSLLFFFETITVHSHNFLFCVNCSLHKQAFLISRNSLHDFTLLMHHNVPFFYRNFL